MQIRKQRYSVEEEHKKKAKALRVTMPSTPAVLQTRCGSYNILCFMFLLFIILLLKYSSIIFLRPQGLARCGGESAGLTPVH